MIDVTFCRRRDGAMLFVQADATGQEVQAKPGPCTLSLHLQRSVDIQREIQALRAWENEEFTFNWPFVDPDPVAAVEVPLGWHVVQKVTHKVSPYPELDVQILTIQHMGVNP